MKQSEIFLETEGNSWHERNWNKPREPDAIVEALMRLEIKPQNILEIGCGSGLRLKELQRLYKGSTVCGVDPSEEALKDWAPKHKGSHKIQGTATSLPGSNGRFDLVIFGFCLYVCDREDLFRIVAESDRVLQDQGYLIVYDFFSEAAHSRAYAHDDRLRSYKMDHARLWLANPSYSLLDHQIHAVPPPPSVLPGDEDRVSVAVLKKDITAGFPLLS